jgi:hypothetical protein
MTKKNKTESVGVAMKNQLQANVVGSEILFLPLSIKISGGKT